LFLFIFIKDALHKYIYSNSLRAARSGDQIPACVRISAPVQTGSGAHPTSYTMGTLFFLVLNRPGHVVDHSPPLSPRLKKE